MVRHTDGKKIGQLLTEAGLITESQLNEALARQREEGGRICSILIRQGHLAVDVLLEFLRFQFGVAAINLAGYRIPEEVLGLIPSDLARQHRLIPLNLLEGTLTVAMENPRDESALRSAADQTGLRIDPLICPEAVVEQALRKYYPALPAVEHPGRRVFFLDERTDHPAVYDVSPPPEDLSPTVWLKRVIFLGIKRRSREIHLEPREEDVLVRYRVGQRLVGGDTVSRSTGEAMVDLLAQLGGRSAGHGAARPREGWFRLAIRNRELTLLFSTFPVIYGDRAVMRLGEEGYLKRALTAHGLDREQEEAIHAALRGRNGMFLVASPVESQRNWLLYHLLELLKNDSLNIITVEQVLLFPLPGVSQTLFSGRRGRRQRDVFEGALRQEPDVIGLADLGDQEMLGVAQTAAARSLIVGSVPYSNTFEALAWLQASKAPGISLAHQVAGLLALAMVPRLCPSCRRPFTGRLDLVEGTREWKPEELKFFESPGCDRCEGTGRAGQTGLYEILLFDDEIRELVSLAAPAKVIWEEAQRRGMKTLLEDGLAKAARGEVDARDVLRVAAPPSEPAR